MGPRLPQQVSWENDMAEHMESAQAFLTAFVIGDEKGQDAIAKNFIFPVIEDGDAELMIYAVTFISNMALKFISESFDVDLEDLLQDINETINHNKGQSDGET